MTLVHSLSLSSSLEEECDNSYSRFNGAQMLWTLGSIGWTAN